MLTWSCGIQRFTNFADTACAGHIPKDIATLTKLKIISLEFNGLTGDEMVLAFVEL